MCLVKLRPLLFPVCLFFGGVQTQSWKHKSLWLQHLHLHMYLDQSLVPQLKTDEKYTIPNYFLVKAKPCPLFLHLGISHSAPWLLRLSKSMQSLRLLLLCFFCVVKLGVIVLKFRQSAPLKHGVNWRLMLALNWKALNTHNGLETLLVRLLIQSCTWTCKIALFFSQKCCLHPLCPYSAFSTCSEFVTLKQNLLPQVLLAGYVKWST